MNTPTKINGRTCAALMVAAALTGTAACSTASGSDQSSGARATCESMLPGRTIQAWESVTVSDLRSFQYGGPVAHVPLEHAFTGAGPAAQGVWCWVRVDQRTGSLWGAVKDHGAVQALTVVGPGGQPHGLMSGPPQPP